MIRATQLTKLFGNTKALNEVTFEIDEGSVFGLVGSNGSGKSTLLRLISGVYMPDSGRICIDSADCFNNPEIKAQIAFLGDTPYFLPQSNIIEMARFYKSVYPTFDMGIYKRMLEIFPLDPMARISAFSKGMQRQAALILAMATCPRYILLDEAFDGLDVVMRRVLSNLIMEGVEKRGMTAVIASHNLRELEDVCDHVGLIHNGDMMLCDRTETLRGELHKIQAAFSAVPDLSVFEKLRVLKIERTGSIVQMVVRGDEDEIMGFIRSLNPVFSECIEPSLEEMFVYELEATGYDVKNILE